jgi:diacylglycerol kinase
VQRFVHAFRGIGCAVRSEANLRIHFTAAALVVALAAWLRLAAVDWAILVLTVGIVVAFELLNTAIEKAVDLASAEYHEFARVAKDTAAGAVLIAAIAAIGVGLFVLGPPMWDRLAG